MAVYPDVLDPVSGVPIVTPFVWKPEQLVLKTSFSNGIERRRMVWDSQRRVFKLNYRALSYDQYTTLFGFYKDRNGPFESFDFHVPHSEPPEIVKVRFEDNGFSVVDTKGTFIDVEVVLRELVE